jgi:hypothetical protein
MHCSAVPPRTHLKHEYSTGVKSKIVSMPGTELCCDGCVEPWYNEAGAGHCADKLISLAAGVPLSNNRKLRSSICKRFVKHGLVWEERYAPRPMGESVDKSKPRRKNK